MKKPPHHATPKADRRKEQKAKASALPEWIDPITLAEEEDEPELNLLGERGYLRRSGGMFIVGPTEVGKSSLATQLSIEWGCNYPGAIIKTANNQALRVLMIQSEDDKQDSREMSRCFKFLKLTPEQEAQVKKNVHFTQWRASSATRWIPGANGNEQAVEVPAIERLLEVLEDAIKKFGFVDIIIVNPLSAYAEEGVLSQRANQRLLYGQIDSFLTKYDCGIIFIHHPPKVRENKQSLYSPVYAAAGDATLANWPRANLFIWPKPGENKLFEFKPEKRANRLGWEGESRIYKWSDEGIFWKRATPEDIKQFEESEKGKSRVHLISAGALCKVFNKFPTAWILQGDLVNALIQEGYTEATARRTIHRDDGYQRNNIEYQGKGKKTKLRWKGYNNELFERAAKIAKDNKNKEDSSTSSIPSVEESHI
jgi:hypothetical protein